MRENTMKHALYVGAVGLLCFSGTAYAAGHEKPYALIGCGITDVTVIDKVGGVTIGQNSLS